MLSACRCQLPRGASPRQLRVVTSKGKLALDLARVLDGLLVVIAQLADDAQLQPSFDVGL
jgi:hypothetical protein